MDCRSKSHGANCNAMTGEEKARSLISSILKAWCLAGFSLLVRQQAREAPSERIVAPDGGATEAGIAWLALGCWKSSDEMYRHVPVAQTIACCNGKYFRSRTDAVVDA